MVMACAIGWRPAEFWSATPHELFAAIDGHGLANGSDRAEEDDRRAHFSEFVRELERAGVA
jgi:hypothetical protein